MAKTVGLVFEDREAERFPCPFCNKDYASPEALDRHVKDKHPDTVQE